MKRHSVLSHLTVLTVFSILFASIMGCEKKEDQSSAENETSSESTITTPDEGTSESSISPLMDQFLSDSPNTVQVTAGTTPISGLFDLWEQIFQHKSMDIHFEVEAEGKVQKDHVWKNETYRKILDEFCQENDLTWKIVGTNTIRIEKKKM